jgi:hypothetical protein
MTTDSAEGSDERAEDLVLYGQAARDDAVNWLKFIAMPLDVTREVGGGPSSNTWLRWSPQRQRAFVPNRPWLRSTEVSTALRLIKLKPIPCPARTQP